MASYYFTIQVLLTRA